MNDLHLFALSSMASAIVFAGHLVDAVDATPPPVTQSPSMAMQVDGCSVTAEFKRKDDTVSLHFWADNPSDAARDLTFQYAASHTPPGPSFSRMPMPAKPTEVKTCTASAGPGRTLLQSIALEPPSSATALSPKANDTIPPVWSVRAMAHDTGSTKVDGSPVASMLGMELGGTILATFQDTPTPPVREETRAQ